MRFYRAMHFSAMRGIDILGCLHLYFLRTNFGFSVIF